MKYRLKKDMPGFEAGAIFDRDIERTPKYLIDGEELGAAGAYFGANCIDTDWFEPLPEAPTRWRPRSAEGFYFLQDYKDRLHFTVRKGDSDLVGGLAKDDLNIFPTKETAQAVADAIKSLLEYVHTPIEGYESSGKPSPSKDYDDPNYINLADQARKAVQANNQ